MEVAESTDAAFPEGFPAVLVRPGAETMSTMTFDQDDAVIKSVSFTIAKDVDGMYKWFLAEIPEAGFTVEHKVQFDTGGGKGFSIIGSSAGLELVATGAGEDSDVFYTVALTEK